MFLRFSEDFDELFSAPKIITYQAYKSKNPRKNHDSAPSVVIPKPSKLSLTLIVFVFILASLNKTLLM